MGKKKSGFLKEFKEFAMKGNMLDLAVGVIVGGAFKTVVDALTNSVIMPVVSMFLGGLSFEEWKIRLPQFFGRANAHAGQLGAQEGERVPPQGQAHRGIVVGDLRALGRRGELGAFLEGRRVLQEFGRLRLHAHRFPHRVRPVPGQGAQRVGA